VVQKEDDMMGISLRYGISLAALKTANPTVDPHFLSVGMTLIIPVTITPTQAPSTLPGKSTATPTPLPVNVEIDQPVCYLVTQTGLTCMALAHNQGDSDLENVSVEFQLAGGSDPGIIQRADTPLDLLIHGAALPVSVTFPSITQASSNITARLSGALPHASADTRYVPATLAEKTIDLYGNYASISGSVHLAGAAQEVWALAAAYNLDGVLVGVRKWESSGPVNGQDVPFSMTVYSLGADIAKVDVFTEAHARANP
jgi:hypothetical protein